MFTCVIDVGAPVWIHGELRSYWSIFPLCSSVALLFFVVLSRIVRTAVFSRWTSVVLAALRYLKRLLQCQYCCIFHLFFLLYYQNYPISPSSAAVMLELPYFLLLFAVMSGPKCFFSSSSPVYRNISISIALQFFPLPASRAYYYQYFSCTLAERLQGLFI